MGGFGVAVVAAVLAQDPAVLARESDDLKALTQIEALWNDAHLRGDADAVAALWLDDSVIAVPGMSLLTKDAAIASLRSGRVKFLRYETSGLRIRVYDNAAVVTGRLQRSRRLGERVLDDDWQFTKVYVRREGRWLAVAFHASAYAP